MKRYLTVAVCLILAVGIAVGVGLGVSANADSYDYNGFKVGYAVADINPTESSMPMAGFSNGSSRKHTSVDGEGLKATVVAMTDRYGKTVLFIGADLIQAHKQVTSDVRNAVSQATGVPVANIYLNASHSHSTVELEVNNVSAQADKDKITRYHTLLATNIAKAAQEACADQEQITGMYAGSVAATMNGEAMNGVRHYYDSGVSFNGGYVGDNFKIDSATNPQKLYDADNNIYLLQFTFGNSSPVVLASYRAHGTVRTAYSGGKNDTLLTADYIGPFRDAMEEEGYRTAFFQGAAGNVNPRNREVGATVNENVTHTAYGQALATCAETGLAQNMTQVSAGRLYVQTIRLETEYPGDEGAELGNEKLSAYIQRVYGKYSSYKYYMIDGENTARSIHDNGGVTMLEMARLIQNNKWNKKLFTSASDAQNDSANSINPYESDYIWKSILDKYSYIDKAPAELEINGIMIGDSVAFVTSPVELFNTNLHTGYNTGMVENSQFANDKTLFVLGYTNGNRSYVPDQWTYNTYDSYEEWVATTAKGTYERIHETFNDILTDLDEAAQQDKEAQVDYTVDGVVHTGTFLQAIESGATHIKVLNNANVGELVISDGITVDLNGYELTGKLSANSSLRTNSGVTLKLMDSANNTYDASKCGTLNCTLENVTVASYAEYVDGDVTRFYVAVEEASGWTAHRVFMKTTAVYLRPAYQYEGKVNPGLYFTSTFAADEKAKSVIASYGVIAHVGAIPAGTADLIDSKYCSVISKDSLTPGQENEGSGVLIYNIMNLDNDTATNVSNAEAEVCGTPYFKLTDGTVVIETQPASGEAYTTQLFSLKQALVNAYELYENDQLTEEAKAAWEALYCEAAFKAEIDAMLSFVQPGDIPVWSAS